MPDVTGNPADALIAEISSWGATARTVAARRSLGRGQDVAAWRTQNHLVQLVEECERMLDEIAEADEEVDVDVHRTELLTAYQAVYGHSPAWASEGSLPDLTPLRRLSGVLRLHLRGSDVGGGDRTVVEAALRDVLDELERADYLSETTRAYLVTLVKRAVDIVVDEASTVATVRSCSHEVAGALVGLAQTTSVPTERRRWWKEKADVVATAVLTKAGTAGLDRMIDAGENAVRLIESGN